MGFLWVISVWVVFCFFVLFGFYFRVFGFFQLWSFDIHCFLRWRISQLHIKYILCTPIFYDVLSEIRPCQRYNFRNILPKPPLILY